MELTTQFPRTTASDYHPEVLKLFDQYVHGGIDRRGFLERAAGLASASGTTATALLAALSPNFAMAQKVAPTDSRIRTEKVEISSPAGHGKINALVAMPAASSTNLSTVLVIHENRGLNPHIEDIARRLAVEGYLAVAPDLLTTQGGYPGDEDQARTAFAKVDQAKARADFVAACAYARTLPASNGKLGAAGFCYGGSMVNFLATQVPELRAGAAFYGSAAAAADVPRIKAELYVAMAGDDERINSQWPAYEAALKANGIRHSAKTFPGTQHGFNNDTTPRFDQTAAAEAWGATLALFKRNLMG